MKRTGIVRRVDELGRIVIPMELRRVLDIDVKDALEIFVDEDEIILKKYTANNACAITGRVLPENKTFGNSKIVLSPEGTKLLFQDLQDYVEVKI
ncbi:AbrB/MazE/SpoVT family DNA-binding domain-containing protein [Bacillus sp. F19]|nr:AbrB/MazE/SpoVT family DNA-binding domain-containing protein [Bacillus sp. F19]